MYNICYLFLLFLIYSIIGYIVEVLSILINYKKLSFHRGFLLGPYLPVFGIGGILMYISLQRYLDDLFALFCMSVIICSFVEFFASLILEKLFKLRWWDYHDKKFNIDGRICLENAIAFGIGGLIFMKFFNPPLISLLNSMPHNILIIISIILFIIFISDLLFTLNSLLKIKVDFNKYLNRDATEEVKQKISDRLRKNIFGTTYIFKSFPKSTYIDNKRLDKFKEQLFEVRKEIKQKRNEYKIKRLKLKKKLIKKSKRDF